MARTMMCPAHGPTAGEYCSVPGCFEVMRPYVAACPERETCRSPGCGMELPCPLHPESAYLDVGTAGRRAQPSVEITLRLQFPWGEIDLPAEGLEIGRDCGQACGAQIDTYDNVSRRHARITTEAATVSVEDLDSTNGTTVNGVRIAPRVPKRVAVGDVLGFGNRLRVSIRSGESE